jgi:phage tail protein X
MSTETITVTQYGMTVDQILYSLFKRYRQGMVERVFALNEGLADNGPVLALGTTFVVPIDAPNNAPVVVPLVTLWS